MAAFAVGKSALSLGKKGLVGRKNVINNARSGSSSSGLNGLGSSNNGGNPNETEQQRRSQESQDSLRRATEAASQSYRAGGALGIIGGAGRMGASMMRTGFHTVGSVFGTKAQKLESREHLKNSAKSVAKGTKNLFVNKKTAEFVGGAVGAVLGTTGIYKAFGKRKAHKQAVYSDPNKMDNLYEKQIQKSTNKPSKIAEKKAQFTGYSNSTSGAVKNKKLATKFDKVQAKETARIVKLEKNNKKFKKNEQKKEIKMVIKIKTIQKILNKIKRVYWTSKIK